MTDAHWIAVAAVGGLFVVADLIFIAWVLSKVMKYIRSFLENTLWR